MSQTFLESLEEAIQRLQGSNRVVLRTGLVVGGVAVSALQALGCGPDVLFADQDHTWSPGTGGSTGTDTGTSTGTDTGTSTGTGTGGTSPGTGGTGGTSTGTGGTGGTGGGPVGTADPSKVTLLTTWREEHVHRSTSSDYSTWLMLRVQPTAGADLAKKSVGVTFRAYNGLLNSGTPAFGAPAQAAAQYHRTLPDGTEEWRVDFFPAQYYFGSPALLFTAWYHDGAGHDYYDDNHGEQYLVECGQGGSCLLRRDASATDVTLTSTGIQGGISAAVAKIDPDDEVFVRWTVDGWVTVNETPMTWVADVNNVGQYRLDLTQPGVFGPLHYTVGLRHGMVNGATPNTIWDDDGGAGYVVAPPDPGVDAAPTPGGAWPTPPGVAQPSMLAVAEGWIEGASSNGNERAHVLLQVMPAPGADLALKRVGVTFRTYDVVHDPVTSISSLALAPPSEAAAHYVRTLPDGHEIWRVNLTPPFTGYLGGAVVYHAWYHDGLGNAYHDDNQGEGHLLGCTPFGGGCLILQQSSTLTLTSSGVQGTLTATVAKIDPDDEVFVRWTVDEWATVTETPMTWVADLPEGRGSFQVDLDEPGPFFAFRYAIGLRHGAVNGATPEVFLDPWSGGDGHLVIAP